ncbi:MAG: TetR/AcrR family transcriptional regulator [Rhodospirillaceae bacterium]|jgi:TetR/AcrR family transcriptional regulator, transcriptional repressor for nem operon|nr:TetR/AcrR family transcriptional regulator [Rhodospirillaceae bacterium]MBT3925486.1 TetR/AcrR family transcriptional regulator [Rhodospirillaceae bacterium]MBT4425570.1 TetR/AcrR family transcriptional regulator [Rhodospirillaceae bacterium]MBT5039298.1 TetR/AcrR family transcriptional regulator [Rhodospirillaceae bacterium]MBT5674595.1 TetR/AcrR family transcriptional regulator [Rhodospirillaceae bacterium]
MARPREFNESDALDDAMQLFWGSGYESASLSEITKATGLSKSSLYDTFGSKHELLLSSLQHYIENMVEPSLTVLEEGPSALGAIEQRFEMIIEMMTAPGPRRGCLIANTTLELGARDKAVAKTLLAAQGMVEQAYARAIERGQVAGEIVTAKDAQSLARYIMACLAGMICLSKSGFDAPMLRDISATAMQAIK